LAERVDLRWFFPKPYRRQLKRTPIFPNTERRSDLTVIWADSWGVPTPTVEGYAYAMSNYLRYDLGAANNCVDLLFGDFSQSWWISWQSAVVMTTPRSRPHPPRGERPARPDRAGALSPMGLGDRIRALVRAAAAPSPSPRRPRIRPPHSGSIPITSAISAGPRPWRRAPSPSRRQRRRARRRPTPVFRSSPGRSQRSSGE
jgi:hypothetical protein